jgi:hypothetical protein
MTIKYGHHPLFIANSIKSYESLSPCRDRLFLCSNISDMSRYLIYFQNCVKNINRAKDSHLACPYFK